jgi:hypothetical protein
MDNPEISKSAACWNSIRRYMDIVMSYTCYYTDRHFPDRSWGIDLYLDYRSYNNGYSAHYLHDTGWTCGQYFKTTDDG